MSVYDRTVTRQYKNKTEIAVCDSVNVEQVIDKLTQPKPIRKSGAMLNVYRKLKYGKPVCTALGLINPVKLDITNLKLRGISNAC